MLKKILGALTIALFFFPSLSYAGWNVDVDLGVSLNIADEDLFLRINAHYYDKDPESIRSMIKRFIITEREYPILLFLSLHSHKNVDFIMALRKKGLSWWDISLKLGIPLSVYFIDIEGPIGPPFGRAYGYWKKHQRNARFKFVLTDDEVYELVSLQMASRYYGIKPEEIMKMRRAGTDFKQIMTDQYRKRHVGHRHEKDKGKKRAVIKNSNASRKKKHGKW